MSEHRCEAGTVDYSGPSPRIVYCGKPATVERKILGGAVTGHLCAECAAVLKERK